MSGRATWQNPTASRVVPVSLFINGQFEDAGIYLPRPVPFVLDTGNIFELEKSGEPQGIAGAWHIQMHTQDRRYDDFVRRRLDRRTGSSNRRRSRFWWRLRRRAGPLPQVVSSGGSVTAFC